MRHYCAPAVVIGFFFSDLSVKLWRFYGCLWGVWSVDNNETQVVDEATCSSSPLHSGKHVIQVRRAPFEPPAPLEFFVVLCVVPAAVKVYKTNMTHLITRNSTCKWRLWEGKRELFWSVTDLSFCICAPKFQVETCLCKEALKYTGRSDAERSFAGELTCITLKSQGYIVQICGPVCQTLTGSTGRNFIRPWGKMWLNKEFGSQNKGGWLFYILCCFSCEVLL